MSELWCSIPLEDYEGHMSAPSVQQLPVLAALFRLALDRCKPESVAVLGVAGGNGLDEIDGSVTKRVVGVDINESYLAEVDRRFGKGRLAGLELRLCNLTEQQLDVPPVVLVHAALIFEHAGLGLALENALALVKPGGHFSVVLQLPTDQQDGVAPTGYDSIQVLKRDFSLINIENFERRLAQSGFRLIEERRQPAASGKVMWLGVFAKSI